MNRKKQLAKQDNMKTMIKLKKTEHDGYCTYKVYWDNGKYLGDFEPMDDGYLAYWPDKENGGAFTEHLLHQLYLELEKLNASWDKTVREGWPPCYLGYLA